MGITIEWDNEEKTVFRWTFESNWTWAEFQTQSQAANAQIMHVGHTVDLLVDMRHCHQLPVGTLVQAWKASEQSPPNIGITVVIGDNPIFPIFHNMFQLLRKSHIRNYPPIHIVPTFEEAYVVIDTEQLKRDESV
jgi:hypothetical protein